MIGILILFFILFDIKYGCLLFDVLCWVNKIMRFCYDSFVVNLCVGNKKCNFYDWFDGIYD